MVGCNHCCVSVFLKKSEVLNQVVGVHENLIAVGSDDQGEAVVLAEMVSRPSGLCGQGGRLASFGICLSHAVVMELCLQGGCGDIADGEEQCALMSSDSGRTLPSLTCNRIVSVK